MLQWLGSGDVRNNIFFNNHQTSGNQIFIHQTTAVTVEYNVISDGYPGQGNITAYPFLSAIGMHLGVNSSAIDAGDPSPTFNDVESSTNPGQPALPAIGNIRSDAGCYGGPLARYLPNVNSHRAYSFESSIQMIPNSTSTEYVGKVLIHNLSNSDIVIDSLTTTSGVDVQPISNVSYVIFQNDILYFSIQPGEYQVNDTLKVHFNSCNNQPQEIPLVDDGTLTVTNQLALVKAIRVFPNPSSKAIQIHNAPLGKAQMIDVSGKVVDWFSITSKREIITPKRISSGIYLLRFSNGSMVRILRE